MTASKPLREEVTFLDGPYAGQTRELPVGDRLGLNVAIDEPNSIDDWYVTYRLTTWNEVTYGHVAPLRLVGARRGVLARELQEEIDLPQTIYKDLEAQVVVQSGVIESTLIRWRRDEHMPFTTVFGVEALACP